MTKSPPTEPNWVPTFEQQLLETVLELEIRLDRIYKQLDVLTKMVMTTDETVTRIGHEVEIIADREY